MGNGSPPPQPTQQTSTQISPEAQRIFNLAFPKMEAFAGSVPQRYNGTGIAGFDPNQVAGQEAVLDSTAAQKSIVQGGANASNFWTGDNVWDPNNNTQLQAGVDAVTRPIAQTYTNDFLPAVRSEAIKAGGLGGSRQGIHEVLGAEKTSRAIGDASSKFVGDQYQTNVNAQLKALGLLPQTAQAQAIAGATQSAVGDVRQSQEQARLNETIGNFNYDQMAPWLQAKELMSVIPGMPGAVTTSTANNPPQPSKMMSALGGAASGAALGSALMPGIGTVAGAGLGALLPFLLA